jgi:hypothetical protein
MAATGEAGEALELHWALSAIDAEERREVVALAEERVTAGDWDEADPEALERRELLAGAYDLAVRDRLEARVLARTPEQLDETAAQVALGATRAFALYAAQPMPDEPTARLLRTLHLSALGVLSQRQADWERWAEDHPVPPGNATMPWDAFLLRQLAELWCDLHQRSGPSGLAHAMSLLAEIREERSLREPALLASAAEGDRARLRFYLFALYHLTDAATTLFLYLSHGRPASVDAELARNFILAREATSGDFRLETVLGWLHAAAVHVAGRRTAQLEIPGVRA